MLDVDYVNFREHLAGEFNTAVALECSPLENELRSFSPANFTSEEGR